MDHQLYLMFGKKKHKTRILNVTISLVLSLALISCSNQNELHEFKTITGETQGTTYTITIVDDEVSVNREDFDSLFRAFDLSLSTYIDQSVISFINNSSDSIVKVKDESGFFKKCYLASDAIYSKTNGAFDPSVFPLIKAWGFMDDLKTPLNQEEVDKVLKSVSFEKDYLHSIQFNDTQIELAKKNANFKLDFNAIAQGLSVDVAADYLSKKGHTNFYVEIGGELFVKGYNKEGEKWRIGIDSPEDDLEKRELNTILHISDKAIATSGNYRKFYVVDGVKYAHTLNPKTGFPVKHSLLSATVVANNATDADGYATAFMVMGKEKSLKFIKENIDLNLEVYLLYADDEGKIKHVMSKGFEAYLHKE